GMAAGIGLAGMAYLAGISVKRLLHARASVHASWLAAVGVGLAASLAVLGVTAGAVWLAARQRRRTSSPLITHPIIGSGLFSLAETLYTPPALVPLLAPRKPVRGLSPLAAIVFMSPPYGALAALSAWLWLTSMRSMRVPRAIRLAVPASDSALLTGII